MCHGLGAWETSMNESDKGPCLLGSCNPAEEHRQLKEAQ